MTLVAKKEPGGAAGLVWEKAGAEGAIEVHPNLAQELLDIPGKLFSLVEKEIKKVEEEVKKVEAPAPVVEEKVGDDLPEALSTASTTKRRSTKE